MSSFAIAMLQSGIVVQPHHEPLEVADDASNARVTCYTFLIVTSFDSPRKFTFRADSTSQSCRNTCSL
jgi:hypothetical protein